MNVCVATTPAVSVLNLLLPKVVGLNFLLIAIEISFAEKSPSGPIKIKWDEYSDLVILCFFWFVDHFFYGPFLGQEGSRNDREP